MKIVRVSGGLGNQLFQYAFARALEERTGDEVFLDLSTYGYEAAHNGFELDRVFAVRYRPTREADIERLGTRPRGALSQLRRKYLTKHTHHIDRVFRYDPRVFALDGDRYFEGWWQTEKYFASIAGTLRQELRFIADPGARNEELLADMTCAGNAANGRTLVSVHVRRGDALKHPNTRVCTEAYYRNAFGLAREHIAQGRGGAGSGLARKADARDARPYFLVFSDDPPWCRANLGLGEDESTFVDWNRGADSWRDMWLMSRCAAVHIIANSSFSWWAAWLDPAPDKLVLAPARWSLAAPRRFAYYRYTFGDVVPENWVKVPTS